MTKKDPIFDTESQVLVIRWSDEAFGDMEARYTCYFHDGMLCLDLRSSLLTLGKAQTSLALPSLNRSLDGGVAVDGLGCYSESLYGI